MKVRVSYTFVTTVRGYVDVDLPEGTSADAWARSEDGRRALDAHRETIPKLDEISGFDFEWVDGSDEPIRSEAVSFEDGSFIQFSD